MERGALKGHGALLLANVIWGLNSPICKTVLLSPENPEGQIGRASCRERV